MKVRAVIETIVPTNDGRIGAVCAGKNRPWVIVDDTYRVGQRITIEPAPRGQGWRLVKP